MSTKTSKRDLLENELERRWAQILNDSTQPRPSWFPELEAAVIENQEPPEMLTLALDIIERFPPNAHNDQVGAVIEDRLGEECLHTYSVLVDWLYTDKGRLRFLDSALKAEEAPEDLHEALMKAWAECLRDVIATVRVVLDKYEDVQAFAVEVEI